MTVNYVHLIDGVDSIQSLYDVGTTQKHAIGTRGTTNDGRVFHYASLADGTELPPHQLAQACVPVTNHVTETGAVTGLGVADTSDAYKTVTVALGATAAYANEYQGGLLKIESATTTGAGQALSIPGHAAVLSSGVLTFKTKDPVVTAVTGTVTWSLLHNPWGSVVVQPAAVTAPAVGVALVSFPAASTTAPVFGWLQTWGLCSVLKDDSVLVAGHAVVNEINTVTGAIAVAATSATDIVGRVGISMAAMATDAVYASVFLQIAP